VIWVILKSGIPGLRPFASNVADARGVHSARSGAAGLRLCLKGGAIASRMPQ